VVHWICAFFEKCANPVYHIVVFVVSLFIAAAAAAAAAGQCTTAQTHRSVEQSQ